MRTISTALLASLLAIGLLLFHAACGPGEDPATLGASDLVGIWELKRTQTERREQGQDFMRFLQDGRMVWTATKGAVRQDLEYYNYRVEGKTIVLDPPPSPATARVGFRFESRNRLIVEVRGKELTYRRVRL